MKKPRKAYKGLWNLAKAEANEQRDRAEAAEHELDRLAAILAVEGEKHLKFYTDKEKEIRLAPLPYECVSAFIDAHKQFSHQPLRYGWHRLMSWRGIPIVQSEKESQ